MVSSSSVSYSSSSSSVRSSSSSSSSSVSGFLQTGVAQALRKVLLSNKDMAEADRREVLAFLSGEQLSGYAPQSGEIVGILKQLADEMQKGCAEAAAAEEAAIQTYTELMAAKTKELEALQVTIESTLERIANSGVAAAQMENDLAATIEALGEDRKFLAELEKGCATATSDFECSKKTRSMELVALTETVKILNDDDSLELFKKTLPSASSSFMQIKATSGILRARAMTAIAVARRAGAAELKDRVQLDL